MTPLHYKLWWFVALVAFASPVYILLWMIYRKL